MAGQVDLLNQYVDTVNRHGAGSSEAEAFLGHHAGDTELIKLCRRTDVVRQKLQSGELALSPGDAD
jgi:hypothetical protein